MSCPHEPSHGTGPDYKSFFAPTIVCRLSLPLTRANVSYSECSVVSTCLKNSLCRMNPMFKSVIVPVTSISMMFLVLPVPAKAQDFDPPAVRPSTGHTSSTRVYRSPYDVAFSPDGGTLAVSDWTRGELVLAGPVGLAAKQRVALRGNPAGVVWSADGRFVYVAERGAGTVAEVDVSGRVVRRLKVGPWPVAIDLARRHDWLLVTDAAEAAVRVLDRKTGSQKARIDVVRRPCAVALTPNEKLAVVPNSLPAGDASDLRAAAVVSLLDLDKFEVAASITLPLNSVNVCGVAVSGDGKWAYVSHNVARAFRPTDMIELGWINANGLTIIDLVGKKRHATLLLDQGKEILEEGLADPWGVTVSPDGKAVWVAFAGVHEVGRLDTVLLHELLDENLPRLPPLPNVDDGEAPVFEDHEIERGAPIRPDLTDGAEYRPGSVELVFNELPIDYAAGLYLHDVLQRVRLPGKGPRGVAMAPNGSRLAVAQYFSGDVVIIDAGKSRVAGVVSLGQQPPASQARIGEMMFHDATLCYQHWLSCATCHPEGRVDGLNWDLLNDGSGTPKNTRSLLLAGRTPPAMASGIRADMEAAVAGGFKYALFHEPVQDELRAVEAYIRAMVPEPSPFLAGGKLSARAREGRALFNNPKTRCAECHSGELLTDLKMYDVGTRVGVDRRSRFDTPTLVELWRTAPYLHHGQARTLEEVLTTYNRDDQHGRTSHLSKEQREALVAYLLSL